MLERIKKVIKIWQVTKSEDNEIVNEVLDDINEKGAFISFPDEDEYAKWEEERSKRESLGTLYDKIKNLL